MVTTPVPTPVPGDRIRFAERRDSTELVAARLVSLNADSMTYERFAPGPAGVRWVPGALPTDSVARLQVKVGRRGNAARGAIIGGVIGVALGMACAAEESSGWYQPSDAQCFAGYSLSGAGTGLLIGALVRNDVWAPALLPARRLHPGEPLVSTRVSAGIGVRIPTGIAGPE